MGWPVLLSELPRGVVALIVSVDAHAADDPIAQRLQELGFVCGEQVRSTAVAPFGGDPMLVQLGYTRFALRLSEARRVHVECSGVPDR